MSVLGTGSMFGLRHEIDVAELAVQLAQILEALAQFGGGEDVALLHLEHRPHQVSGVRNSFTPTKLMLFR